MTKETLREAIESEIAHMRENDGRALMCEGVAKRLESILARFPKPSGPTVRVRAAVRVDRRGFWSVNGWDHGDNETMSLEADERCQNLSGESGRLTFIECDVPAPAAPVTVEATEVTP